MPRTRRAAALPADAPATPEPQETASVPETPPTDTPNTPRRRGRRTVSAATESPAPVLETADEPPAAETAAPPKRRGGRRKATESAAVMEAASETVASLPDVEAPAVAPAEPGAPAPRRGRRRAGTPQETSTAQTAPVSPPDEPKTPVAEEASAPPVSPARRRGRRTSTVSAAASPALPDTEAPVVSDGQAGLTEGLPASAPEAAPSASPRRRGRRSQALPTPPVDVAAPVAEETDAAATAEQDVENDGDPGEARRGRRGRRSRRRRNGEDILPTEGTEDTLLVVPEAVTFEEETEEEAAAPLPIPEVPIFVAPLLVPSVQAPAEGAILPRVSAHLDFPERGLPQIVVNDAPHAPFFFFVNTEEAADGAVVDRELAGAASAGIHLYSGVCYLPFRNAYGHRSFGAVDALVQQVLAADPDAYILPRLQCVPTNFWARTHEDQMAQYADGSEGDVSLASSEFWADATDALDALIAHFADPATPGGERVIGFHLDRGEWFYDAAAGYDQSDVNRQAFGNWLHAKYQQTYRLRASWIQNSADFDGVLIPEWTVPVSKSVPAPIYSAPRDGRWPDYHLFASDLVAQAITGMAEAVKVLSGGRMLTAVSYGYTLEFAGRPDSGHLALARVLDSPHIDILAGPNSYTGRGAGGPGALGAPVDSVALHGKLWLVEDDTKTFLAEAETPDTYNPKIAGGADTQAAHQRTFGTALAHRAGVTWMDLWGQGWLDSPDIWDELGGFTRQAARWQQLGGTASPSVVVFVDEASLAFVKAGANGLGQTLVGKTRELLLRSGASVGFYLQSDVLQDNVPDAKLYLFLNALRLTTPERAAVQEKLQTAGKTLAWLYAPGIFDEDGLSATDASDAVGITLRPQPWNMRLGSQITDTKHPLTERLRAGRRTLGQDEVLNPSYAVADSQAVVLAEYAQGGGASLAVREHSGGWKSVFIGDPYLSPELLRGLYAYAGVPVVGTQDDVTHAAEGVLLVHAAFTGQRTLNLPRPATVYDAQEDRIAAVNARTFRAFLRARTTRLFLWGDADAVAGATGLSLPDSAAQDAIQREGDEAPAPSTPLQEAVLPETITVIELDEVLVPVDEAEGDADPEDISQGDEEGIAGEAENGSRRSRWQRRRAALRARRDAERAVRDAGGASGTDGPPVDLASLLPDLPPRLAPSNLPDGGGEDAE